MTTPNDIAGLVSWYQASAAYCFSNAGGTTPCADGDTVYVWKDRKGTNNLTQATSGLRPTYHDDGTTRYVTFGGDRYMDYAAGIVTVEPLSLSVWLYPTASGTVVVADIGQSATVNDFMFFSAIGTSISARAYTGAGASGTATSSAGPTLNTWNQAVGVYTSSTSRAAYSNGGNKGTDATSVTVTGASITTSRLGARLNATLNITGRVSEVAVWSTALTDQNVSDLYTSGVPTLDAPANTVAPAVTGTATQGQTLSCSTGTWTGSGISYTYQWQRSANGSTGWADISSATASTYVLVSADGAQYVRCVVTATNTAGSTAANSNTVGPITPLAPVNSVAPAVTGTATQGEVLTTGNGTWTNSPTSYTYQWQRSANGSTGWANISSATAATYTLVSADSLQYVRAAVTAVNSGGSTAANSNVVGSITPLPPVISVAPVATGADLHVGQVVSSTTGTWTNSPTSYSYFWQWSGDGVSGWVYLIGGTAQTANYTIRTADVGGYLRCDVAANNSGGQSFGSQTNVLGPVLPLAPTISVAPALSSATAALGVALTCGTGTWTPAVTTTYAGQWQKSADGSTGWANTSAGVTTTTFTNDTLTPTAAHVGFHLRCAVTATNAGGTGTANSNATGSVASPLSSLTLLLGGQT